GRGMSREIFGADVEFTPDPSHRSGPYVVLLPLRGADAGLNERVRRELRLLARLSGSRLGFRIPNCEGAYPVSGGLALVRRFVRRVTGPRHTCRLRSPVRSRTATCWARTSCSTLATHRQ